MKATFKNKTQNGSNTYALAGTKEELASYKAAKGAYYIEDEAGTPLYWTKRSLSSKVNYKLDEKGYLVDSSALTETQTVIDNLAAFNSLSVTQLQKFAALKQAGLVVEA